MLSTDDLERLIAAKRLEIEREKIALGLSPPPADIPHNLRIHTGKENNVTNTHKPRKHNSIDTQVTCNDNERDGEKNFETIPRDLERYIRRYIGLPVMLKAGEFSPNNPLLRNTERTPNDVFVGLGDYERRKNTLRKIQQQQYREYLDQQAKKKQQEKEKAEKERREREEKERKRDEERERLRRELEQERANEQRRASVCYVPTVETNNYRKKADAAVQVGISRPLSVACQTDDDELYRVPPSQPKTLNQITEAERELSPRTVQADCDERPIQPARWGAGGTGEGDHDERYITKKPSDKYTPSLFDADAIHQRNLQAQKEAIERKQFYQLELKNQILDQQRIKEERKTREKLLEQAELRRLEGQLRMLRMAHESELAKQYDIDDKTKENTTEFNNKRTSLQKEIDSERQVLRNRTHNIPKVESQSCYKQSERKLPFSTNIPETSIFAPNYDVEGYLRRNLNPSKESLKTKFNTAFNVDNSDTRTIIEKALVHDWPKEKKKVQEKPRYEPSFLKRDLDGVVQDEIIPVLPVKNDSPLVLSESESKLSDKMKLVDDKWKVPAVQKNLLKSLPTREGKNVSILTQLGSIRRQLQLEQLRLDNMVKK